MDLKANAKIVHDYFINPNTSVITVTFRDALGLELGTIEIEEARFRPFIEALHIVSKELYGEYSQGIQKQTTSFAVNDLLATTEFFS